jgi:glucose-specific phosphotransferase system IIA component
MFGWAKKDYELLAPIDGKVIDLSLVPDSVFSERIAGDGVAIDSTGDLVVAPVDGNISLIFRTNHAFGMMLSNGAEIIVHIGIDTVELDGYGFERLKEEGSKVKAGDPIIKINRKQILDKGFSLITPVLITNPNIATDINYKTGIDVKAGKNTLFTYKIK